MNKAAPSTRCILMLCVAMLLLAQIMGLHLHRHVDLGTDADGAHTSQLHFEDGGLHRVEAYADHHHDSDHASAERHAHLDIESKAVKPGFAKVFAVVILLATLAFAGLLWAIRRTRSSVRPPSTLGRYYRSRYALGPPSHAPPFIPVVI